MSDRDPTNPFLSHLDELERMRASLYDAERDVGLEAEGVVGERLLKFFAFKHLPPKLSALFCELALAICRLTPSAERTVALRKLLESKDAAVRAAL